MNIVGTKLKVCNTDPMTGWRRDGFCSVDDLDYGTHIVCAVVTKKFLEFTKSKGNDLMSKSPFFPGLKEGDKWCLCITRWIEAYFANVAPKVVLESTSVKVSEYLKRFNISLDEFMKYGI